MVVEIYEKFSADEWACELHLDENTLTLRQNGNAFFVSREDLPGFLATIQMMAEAQAAALAKQEQSDG